MQYIFHGYRSPVGSSGGLAFGLEDSLFTIGWLRKGAEVWDEMRALSFSKSYSDPHKRRA